jgi:hypothetical protein
VRVAVAGAAAVLIATALAACGSAHNTPRRQLADYLAAVVRIERQLAAPINAVDVVDRQLTAGANTHRPGASTPPSIFHLTSEATEERTLQQAELQIRAVSDRLRALAAPAPAAHLKALSVQLVDRQADLTVQTSRLIAFIPGFTRSLRPLGPAVVALERVLSVNQAYGSSAVQLVYARKAAALRTFAQTLDPILASLARLRPPASSQPTYMAERQSLGRMRASALTLASDLAAGHTTGLAAVLRSFDRAAALPTSRSAQAATVAAIRAYDQQVGQLSTLVAAADRERLRLARLYP